MKTIGVPPPENYIGLSYPTGKDMGAVRLFARTLAPYVDTLIEEARRAGMTPRLVCRGSSGAMLSSALLMFMEHQVMVAHVKKDGERAHCNHVYNSHPNDAAIVVDDFVETGSTVEAIADAVSPRISGDPITLYAIVLSNGSEDDATEVLEKIADRVTFYSLVNLNRP